jgi:ATP-binding cassette subfamily B protein
MADRWGAARTWYGRWSALLRLLPQAGAGMVVASVMVNLLIGLLPIAFIVWIGAVLGELPDAAAAAAGGSARWSAILAALVLAVAAFVLQQLLAPFQTALGEVVVRRVDGHCVSRLSGAALVEAPIAVLEQPEVVGRLGDARAGFDRVLPTPGDAAAGVLALLARYAQLAGAAVLVALVISPLAGVVITLTALVIRFGQRGSLGRFAALWDGLYAQRQRVMYLRAFGASTKAAKEFRMLGILGWYRERHLRDSRAYLRPLWAGRRRILLRPFIGYALVGLAGAGLVLYWLARSVAGDTLSPVGLAIAIQAVLIPVRFGVFFPESDVQTQYGMQAHDALTTFERTVARGHAAVPAGTRRAEHGPVAGIRFDEVIFSYREAGHPVLDGVTLELPAGRSTAIVGLNGAGKTTLVKLLARFYDPTAGRILVDGVDLREYDPRSWQRSLAVIFQDYVRYELDAAANIGFGAVEAMHDRAALRAAAARAGAAELLAALPGGLETPLSRRYRGGTDLSGGQWQRVALARALFAVQQGASVLVLDEPTAQLDIRAEVEFYDRFIELTEGLTTVIISHRFSTVRRADRIAVLDGGAVTECGSHEQLVAAGGRYAELFALQARRFTEVVG